VMGRLKMCFSVVAKPMMNGRIIQTS